jgi:hypothetical protein
MNMMTMNKPLQIWLNALRPTTPDIDAHLHNARRIQLVKLEVKSLQSMDNEGMGQKPQTSIKTPYNNNLVIMSPLHND